MHQNRASPFASDFYCRRGSRKEFCSEGHFYPFSSQKKSRFASNVFAEELAHLGAQKIAIFGGAVKIAESRDFGALRVGLVSAPFLPLSCKGKDRESPKGRGKCIIGGGVQKRVGGGVLR